MGKYRGEYCSPFCLNRPPNVALLASTTIGILKLLVLSFKQYGDYSCRPALAARMVSGGYRYY